MTDTAVGIHSHPKYKIGARPGDPDRPRINFADIRSSGASLLSGPIVPNAVDDTTGVTFGLDNNDRFGVCVPTGFDNFIRMCSYLFTGTQVSADWEQIVAWYREQNPDFNPDTGAGDNGMVIQPFLEARVKDGTIVAFASVQTDDEEEVKEAVWLFLGLVLAVDLQMSQQKQTDDDPPTWDYKRSSEWGGHCVMEPAFEDGYEDVISWLKRVRMTQKFIGAQRLEAWAVITKWHLEHPTFREGIDVPKLEAEFKRLTGKDIVIPEPGPAPTPTPAPPGPGPVPTDDEVDAALWTIASDWVLHHRHGSGEAAEVAAALKEWAIGKGLLKP